MNTLYADEMTQPSTRKAVLALATMSVLFLSGCGEISKLTEGTTTSGTFSDVYTKTLNNDCIQCHDGADTNQFGNLDFSSQTKAYESLTSGTVSGPSSGNICAGVKLVDAGVPASSYLLATLFTDYTASSNYAGVATCIPYNAHALLDALSSSKKASLVAWVTSGALND